MPRPKNHRRLWTSFLQFCSSIDDSKITVDYSNVFQVHTLLNWWWATVHERVSKAFLARSVNHRTIWRLLTERDSKSIACRIRDQWIEKSTRVPDHTFNKFVFLMILALDRTALAVSIIQCIYDILDISVVMMGTSSAQDYEFFRYGRFASRGRARSSLQEVPDCIIRGCILTEETGCEKGMQWRGGVISSQKTKMCYWNDVACC